MAGNLVTIGDYHADPKSVIIVFATLYALALESGLMVHG